MSGPCHLTRLLLPVEHQTPLPTIARQIKENIGPNQEQQSNGTGAVQLRPRPSLLSSGDAARINGCAEAAAADSGVTAGGKAFPPISEEALGY